VHQGRVDLRVMFAVIPDEDATDERATDCCRSTCMAVLEERAVHARGDTSGLTLRERAEAFQLGHYTIVSTAIGQGKRGVQGDAGLRERLADGQRCLDACNSNT
jgi:hypothetical protein